MSKEYRYGNCTFPPNFSNRYEIMKKKKNSKFVKCLLLVNLWAKLVTLHYVCTGTILYTSKAFK